MKRWKINVFVTLFWLGVLGGVIALGNWAGETVRESKFRDEAEKEAALVQLYEAWIQDTGNPKKLTKDHFRLLKVQRTFRGWELKNN